MTEVEVFDVLMLGLAGLGAAVLVILTFIAAPYGRHLRRGFGPCIGGTTGWVLMESVAALLPPAIYLTSARPLGAVPWVFLAIWEIHYVNRAFVYPFRRPTTGTMPLVVVGLGLVFNLVNAYLNARWLTRFAPARDLSWLTGPRFLLGLGLFVVGYAINQHSDQVLLRLRRRGETAYRIPQRGLHRYVASPNYFGELLEWSGFAVLTWSPAAAVFAWWTAANLVPRAFANRRWYREKFPDYPPERRALVPYVL